MATGSDDTDSARPVLLCFDGSDGAAEAIAEAGTVLRGGKAVLLTVWEPCAVWEPYDPATILSAPLVRLADRALGFDEIARIWPRRRWSAEWRWRAMWDSRSPGGSPAASRGGRSAM